MKRLVTLPAAMLVLAMLWPAPAGAQTETSVTGAGEGAFPAQTSYLGVPLQSLTLGMGLAVDGSWAEGQFQVSLTGVSQLGIQQTIDVDGMASSSVPGASGTAIVSGECTVDMGDGTPPTSGIPFTVVIATNPDGTGSLTLTLGSITLPAATLTDGNMTIR